MAKNFSLEKKILFLLSGIAVLYLFTIHAYFVGFFNDDAFHIIGAQSLAQGRYVELNNPNQPPLMDYTPGYPLLLAPLTLIAGDSFLIYQLFSILLIGGGLFLAWKIFSPHLSPLGGVVFLLLAALNPLVVSLSGTVLSDVAFLFFAYFIFWCAQKYWKNKDARTWMLIGFLAGFHFYIRPIGGVSILAVFLCLLIEKRWKEAIIVALSSAVLLCPYFVRNILVRGDSLSIGTEFSSMYKGQNIIVQVAILVWENLNFYLKEFFGRIFIRLPGFPGKSALDLIVIIGGTLLVFFGIKKWGIKSWEKVPVLFLLGYLGVHFIWSRQSGRYLLPLIPILFGFFIMGLERFVENLKQRRIFLLAVLVIGLGFMSRPLSKILQASLTRATPTSNPALQTFDWINQNTNPSSIIGAEYDGRIFIYTKRRTLHFPKGLARTDFLKWARQNHVEFILVASTEFDIGTKNPTPRYNPLPLKNLTEFLSDPDQFGEVYRNTKEETVIFQTKNETAI